MIKRAEGEQISAYIRQAEARYEIRRIYTTYVVSCLFLQSNQLPAPLCFETEGQSSQEAEDWMANNISESCPTHKDGMASISRQHMVQQRWDNVFNRLRRASTR